MHLNSHRCFPLPALLGIALVVAAALPAGAISVFDEVAISAALTGRGQSPPVATTAAGQCTGRLVVSTGNLTLTCSSNVAGAGRLILTQGSPSGGGAELFDLGSGPVVGGTVNLSDELVAKLLAGELYLAVTSPAHPSGEIAARVVPRAPMGARVMRFSLANDSMVQTPSQATGDCALAISADSNDVKMVCSHSVANPVELRVMVDGGIAATASNVASPFEIDLPVLENNLGRLIDGDYGVVLTSQQFPNGELGRVLDRCIEGPNALCLADDRYRVTVKFQPPGQGVRDGHTVSARSGDAGLFWFFNPSNFEVLVKVLFACPVNGHYWVFLSANTNVKFDVTVYDTLRGRTRSYSNPQGRIAASRADTEAFACP